MKVAVFSILFSLLISVSAIAGNTDKGGLVIRGKVSDASEQSLAGVIVKIPGTNFSTITDFDGHFTLTVPSDVKDAKVTFELVSYQTESAVITRSGSTEYSIVLQEK